jgi:calcium/calmodulin-dependent protein kinase I
MKADLPTVFVSCFDKDSDDDPRGSFWKRISDIKEIAEIERRPTLIESLLHKNKLENEKEPYFVLKQGLLYYTSSLDNPVIVGIAKLSFQKIEVFQSSVGTEKIYGIRIYSSLCQTKLLSTNRDLIVDWYSYLSPMLINRDFFSKYELKELLGEGAFSQVYRVIDRKSGTAYAAKVIKHKMIHGDQRGVLLMKQEIDIMRQLDHPNIVKLYEVQEVNNAVILIQEILQGCELKKMNMKLTFQNVLAILKSLVSVIAYLEGLGIVHRDLKPSNIMIVGGETSEKLMKISTKVIDFGLATFLTEKLILTKCGTPGYIAPEILNQSSRDKIVVNPNVDVYSLGIILYEMVYKSNPFKELIGKNDSKKVVRKNSQSFLDFSKPMMYKSEIENRVIDLMKEMTHRDERERPLASQLLHNPVILNGNSLFRNSDYHPHIDENVKSMLASSPYSFKVNKSKFNQFSKEGVKKPVQKKRPLKLNLKFIDDPCTTMIYMEQNSPIHHQILSPLQKKDKYIRDHFVYGEKIDGPGSAASLEKRFRGMKRSDSPLQASDNYLDPSQAMNQSRNSFRTSSVGKANHKSQLVATKKNTGIGMHSTSGGGLFVLQKCDYRDEKPSFYN